MELEKSLVSGSMSLLVLKLLEDGDLYGYQMITELRQRSEDAFRLKAGTLYPLLHSLEEKGLVTAYERTAESGKARRYYHLTKQGQSALREKESAWNAYTRAVGRVLKGGASLAGA
ncbi:PadR family transcriptional regulator [Oscillibacter sp.]|uniref:PadR family transcriptional regulator n=1 Tax=Oscillibacter sp. TaxID=1945593 RepID=UPI002D804008|nr:helix-turn-helix transcriptional regulator [Oscillibacter sp.]